MPAERCNDWGISPIWLGEYHKLDNLVWRRGAVKESLVIISLSINICCIFAGHPWYESALHQWYHLGLQVSRWNLSFMLDSCLFFAVEFTHITLGTVSSSIYACIAGAIDSEYKRYSFVQQSHLIIPLSTSSAFDIYSIYLAPSQYHRQYPRAPVPISTNFIALFPPKLDSCYGQVMEWCQSSWGSTLVLFDCGWSKQ